MGVFMGGGGKKVKISFLESYLLITISEQKYASSFFFPLELYDYEPCPQWIFTLLKINKMSPTQNNSAWSWSILLIALDINFYLSSPPHFSFPLMYNPLVFLNEKNNLESINLQTL